MQTRHNSNVSAMAFYLFHTNMYPVVIISLTKPKNYLSCACRSSETKDDCNQSRVIRKAFYPLTYKHAAHEYPSEGGVTAQLHFGISCSFAHYIFSSGGCLWSSDDRTFIPWWGCLRSRAWTHTESCQLQQIMIFQWFCGYHKVSNIRRTKSQNLNDPRLILQMSLPNPLKPGVKSRMKM